MTQGSLGDGGVLRRRGEPELGRNLFRRREPGAPEPTQGRAREGSRWRLDGPSRRHRRRYLPRSAGVI